MPTFDEDGYVDHYRSDSFTFSRTDEAGRYLCLPDVSCAIANDWPSKTVAPRCGCHSIRSLEALSIAAAEYSGHLFL